MFATQGILRSEQQEPIVQLCGRYLDLGLLPSSMQQQGIRSAAAATQAYASAMTQEIASPAAAKPVDTAATCRDHMRAYLAAHLL